MEEPFQRRENEKAEKAVKNGDKILGKFPLPSFHSTPQS